MNILIINQPLNNRGDEAAHKGLIRSILQCVAEVKIRVLFLGANQNSIAQFAVASEQVEYINEKNSHRLVWGYLSQISQLAGLLWLSNLHPNFRRLKRYYQWADIIVCAPGGICMGGFQSWGHLFYLQLAKHMHKPLAYYGRSFGPFPTAKWKNRRFKAISMKMLHYFSYLSIRDKKTEELAKQLRIDYVSTVDSAFLDLPRVTIPQAITQQIGANKYFVFVPNLLIWHYAYRFRVTESELLNFYGDIVHMIFQRHPDFKAVLLPQTFNYTTAQDNDINFFRSFAAFIKDSRITVIEDIYSSDIQQAVIAQSEFVIGARYHSVVFAINNAVPFIALGYEHKIAGLLETLGKSECMVDIQERICSSEGRKEMLEEFSRKFSYLSADKQAKEKAKAISQTAFTHFYNWLSNHFKQ